MSLKTNVGRGAGELLLAIQSGPTKNGSLLDLPSGQGLVRYSGLSLKDLVCLCADPRNDDAWDEFVSRVAKPIGLAVMRTASLWGKPSRSVVEDLVHETYIKLLNDSCRHLRDFAISIKHPEADDAILRYIRKTAANTAHDYFKHLASQKSGGDNPHVSLDVVNPEDPRSQERIHFQILLKEIDEHLKHCLTGPDQERDRTIFWLYFRHGMSCEEIASLPTIRLGAKGVGGVIERLKRCLRERILRARADSEDDND